MPSLPQSVLLCVLLCGGLPAANCPGQTSHQETFRPQYHFTPAKNWMNDPNGLVYFQGEYHLFYQYNPLGDKWGHMSWGHAVSPDLVHWQELPVAIPEVGKLMAFSGSAVVDWKNTSGFGTGGQPPLLALYTGHVDWGNHQSQYLAYSNDRGRTWQNYAGNPVLDLHLADFRDPKVSWYALGGFWVMAVSLPNERQIAFYRSDDLKQWTRTGEFGPAGSTTGIWECPDLFPLPVEGLTGIGKWILIVNVGDGAVAGGSGTQYFVGHFDGKTFTADPMQGKIPTRWVDFGRDFYAAVTWSDIPATDGRRLLLGWMNNWKYGQEIPTGPWRSAQSMVRVLDLVPTDEGLRLRQTPAAEYQTLRGPAAPAWRDVPLPAGTLPLAGARQDQSVGELTVEFELGRAAEVGLVIGSGESAARIRYEAAAARLSFERPSGQFAHPGFSGKHSATVPVRNGRVALHVFVDRSLVEVYADGGLVTLSDQIFPPTGPLGLSAYAAGGNARIITLQWWPLRSIWP